MQRPERQIYQIETAIEGMKDLERFLRAALETEKARFDKLLKSVPLILAIVTKLDEWQKSADYASPFSLRTLHWNFGDSHVVCVV